MRNLSFAVGLAIAALACGGDDEGSSSGSGGSKPDPLTRELDVEGDGVTLHVSVAGNLDASKTLVLLGGGPGLSATYLAPLAVLGTDAMRVVAYDPRGMGGSTAPASGDYSPDALAGDLEAVRKRIGVKQIHLLGHGFGIVVAWAYLAAHPDNVASVIAMDGWGPTAAATTNGFEELTTRVSALQGSGQIPTPLPPDTGDDCAPAFQAQLPAFLFDPAMAIPAELTTTQCSRSVLDAGWAASIGANYDYSTVLIGFQGPSLVVFGKNDPIGTQLGQFTVTALSASQPAFNVLPGTGHYPWVENPNAIMHARDFLAPL